MPKLPSRKNCTLLALAIVYGIVAIIQLFADGFFPMQLYFSVAFISVLTTLCECLKSSIKWVRLISREYSNDIIEKQNRIREHIAVFDQYPALLELTELYKNGFEDISKYYPKRFYNKFFDFIERILPFAEIFQILFIAIITPLKIVPNDFLTNKIINILSLLSVAFAFGSIYMNEVASDIIDQIQEERYKLFQTSDHYLYIIKKITEAQQVSAEGVAPDGND